MEYRSRSSLLGLPLVHVATTEMRDGRLRRGIAKGWIAVGDISFGVLFATGGVAVGGIAFGGAGVGVICLAGCAVGCAALGGLAVGIWALGGAAIAAHAALGGLAIAGKFALGGQAIAEHAGDAAAVEFFSTQTAFRIGDWLARHARWLVLLFIGYGIGMLLTRKKRDRGDE